MRWKSFRNTYTKTEIPKWLAYCWLDQFYKLFGKRRESRLKSPYVIWCTVIWFSIMRFMQAQWTPLIIDKATDKRIRTLYSMNFADEPISELASINGDRERERKRTFFFHLNMAKVFIHAWNKLTRIKKSRWRRGRKKTDITFTANGSWVFCWYILPIASYNPTQFIEWFARFSPTQIVSTFLFLCCHRDEIMMMTTTEKVQKKKQSFDGYKLSIVMKIYHSSRYK